VGNLSIEKRNFDITDVPDSLSDLPGSFTGGGQRLILEAQPGTEYSRYRLQFSEPYMGGSQNSLRISAFRSVLLRPDYIEDRSSAGITVGRLFSLEEKLRGTLGFRNDRVSVDDVSMSAPSVVINSAGKTTYSAIDLNLDWDRRVYRPVIGAVDGWYLETGYSHIGGPLGGDLEIGKLSFGTGLFRTIHENSDELRHVFAMRTSFNWAEPLGKDDFIPVFERFYLGGPRSLRGFDYRGAGPRGENGAEIGGTVRHRGSLEYTWPLLDNTLRGIVFTDFGNLSDGKAAFSLDEYRVGVGGGIVLNIPIFGQPLPISITWTEAVKKEDGDRLQEFSFDLGWFLY
jgi:outer membrane protein insertion porin family